MSLVSTPEGVTILHVVNAVEPIGRIGRVPSVSSNSVCTYGPHQRLDNSLEMVEEAFRNTTLAEVLSSPDPSVPLCDVSGRSVESHKHLTLYRHARM